MESTPQFVGRSLYDLDDYSADEIMYILEAASMKEINLREYKNPYLMAKLYALFIERCTCRMSFELAANRLSADVVSFQAPVSSLKKEKAYRIRLILSMQWE